MHVALNETKLCQQWKSNDASHLLWITRNTKLSSKGITINKMKTPKLHKEPLKPPEKYSENRITWALVNRKETLCDHKATTYCHYSKSLNHFVNQTHTSIQGSCYGRMNMSKHSDAGSCSSVLWRANKITFMSFYTRNDLLIPLIPKTLRCLYIEKAAPTSLKPSLKASHVMIQGTRCQNT